MLQGTETTHPTTLVLFDAISQALAREKELASIISSLDAQAALSHDELLKYASDITSLEKQSTEQLAKKEHLAAQLLSAIQEDEQRISAIASTEIALDEQRKLLSHKRKIAHDVSIVSKIVVEMVVDDAPVEVEAVEVFKVKTLI